jgi:type 1 glutamine amidotransferase
LHEADVRDLDQWVSDFAACDTAYLMHFYKTGEKRPFRSFWRENAPLLEPLAIPTFRPTRWISRYDGTVV